ncbi:hypothetical protein FBU30_010697 [Linnemannia zychae]|nr:hypothetical protein FBU30_010697 [Linnemannia zychae]
MKERYRVAIIADPQLTDWYSYGQSGILLTLVETYTDIYMRRAFNRLHSSLRPDAVLFLGDLNDGGRDSNDKIFEKNRERFFERVFKTKQTAWNQQPLLVDPEVPIGDNHNGTPYTPSTHYRQVQNIPLDADVREKMRQNGKSVRLYVAGNHDVGFGDTLIRPSMTRYKGVFGATNYEVTVGNHSFVVLDSLSISSNIKDIRQESDQFLNKITQEPSTLPRILFTHVPLFRHGTTQCGPERETKKMILSGNGTQYQNLVNRTLTQQILTGIQPDMIFSGDDHDWCEVAHPIPNNSSHNNVASSFAPEVTLPTFSFAQGIWQPGFVVMSLYNPNLQKSKNVYPLVPVSSGLPVTLNDTTYLNSVAGPTDDTTFAYAECLLPIQLFIYLGYGLFFICTLLIIGGSQLWRMAQSQKQPSEMGTAQYLDMTTLPESHRPAHSSTANALPLSMSTPTNSWYNENNDGNDNSTERKGFWRPLYSIAFWKACGWDIWNIAKYAIPFYIFLFVISFF